MNVVFLDYDGVVNTPMWLGDGSRCSFNFPRDNKVNNFQSVQWVSEFCQKNGYSIVISSSWRFDDNYKECLINGGLRDGIEILGRTPNLPTESRGAEIKQYILEHPEITSFLIFDDEDDMDDLSDYLVECNPNTGFGMTEMFKAERLHQKFENERMCGRKSVFDEIKEGLNEAIEFEETHRNYNPVERAYNILYKVFSNEKSGWDDANIAIEEAIGYLGEALAD